MTFMVVLVSGLTAGLGSASVSALARLPVDHLAFAAPASGQDVSFTGSALPGDTAARLTGRPGVTAAYPLGVSTVQLHRGDDAVAVTAMGTDTRLLPSITSGHPPRSGELAITARLAGDHHLHVGDDVVVAGRDVTVAAVVEDASFNHLPVAYTDVETWQAIAHTDQLSAVALVGGPATPVPGITTVTKTGAYAAVGGYSSEQGSLNLMRVLLITVSVLVVGSFFTVWTMQRSGDLAVVRALGGGRSYLLRDALGQALLVLVAGAAIGAGLATAVGLVAAAVVPIELSLATVAVPLAAMTAVGLLGAAVSIRRITTVDPLNALGATR